MLEFEEIQEIKPNIEILELLQNYTYTVKNGKIRHLLHTNLHVSVAGHPVSGENELDGIKRKILEEIGQELDILKLEYLFTFSQEVIENNGKFLYNMFYDVYLIEMNLDINKLKLQKEEVSGIYYKDFEKMVKNKNKDIVNHPEEWKRLFKILHERYE